MNRIGRIYRYLAASALPVMGALAVLLVYYHN